MGKDEKYIIDLCDQILGVSALRQHRFPFLVGDPDKRGICRKLPVDAFYENLNLVVEYRERQHSEVVKFFDRRMTNSGVYRGEQRRIYDQRRRDILPQHGIELIEFDYSIFPHNSHKRLLRIVGQDKAILRNKLSAYIGQ
jgi:hypothetical protein